VGGLCLVFGRVFDVELLQAVSKSCPRISA
jgi:hypothetical protein